MRRRPFVEVFEASMRGMDECWPWQGPIGNHGYGTGGKGLAHRIICELAHGPIPDGYEVDHLCRVKTCVNPDHLEAVPKAENLRRQHEANYKTTCNQGHQRWGCKQTGVRFCLECRRLAALDYHARKRVTA